MHKLSIIIVNWNTKDLLNDCLSSIFEDMSAPALEVIVVDNDSGDGSAEMVKANYQKVVLIENRDNVGFARGNNQGISISKGEYILLLNPDTIVKSGALSSLISFAESSPRAGAVGVKLVDEFGNPQCSYGYFPRTLSLFFGFSVFFSKLGILKSFYKPLGVLSCELDAKPEEVEYVSGACMLVRSEVISEVGMLDEDYFTYFEETDWCYRIRRSGWQIFYYPEAEIVHFGGASMGIIGERSLERYFTGLLLFLRKNRWFFHDRLALLVLKNLWRFELLFSYAIRSFGKNLDNVIYKLQSQLRAICVAERNLGPRS